MQAPPRKGATHPFGVIIWVGGLEMYGTTDGQMLTHMHGIDWARHPGLVDRPLWGEVKVLGPDGTATQPGAEGEIYTRSVGGQPSRACPSRLAFPVNNNRDNNNITCGPATSLYRFSTELRALFPVYGGRILLFVGPVLVIWKLK